MDQMLLTGLVSFRFSSLADSASPWVTRPISSSGDSLTAPKLKFSPLCTGTRRETCPSGEKGSWIGLMLDSTSGDSVARTAWIATSRLNPITVNAKYMLDFFIFLPYRFSARARRQHDCSQDDPVDESHCFHSLGFRLVAGRFRGVLQSLQRIVNRKAAGLLARWELPKGGEELRDVLLRRHHDESVVHPPP